MPRRSSLGPRTSARGRGPHSAPQDPYATALRLLSQRAYSSGELLATLKRKFPGEESLPGVIERLRKLKFLDDRRFAEHRASFLARHRGWGRFRVQRELKARKVPEKWIGPAVERAFRESDERELARKLVEKKLRGARFPLSPQKFSSLSRSLMRRGFPADVIMDSIRAYRRGDASIDQDDLIEAAEEE